MTHCEESNTKKIVSHGRRLISPDCFRFATRSVENNAMSWNRLPVTSYVCFHMDRTAVFVYQQPNSGQFLAEEICVEIMIKKTDEINTHSQIYFVSSSSCWLRRLSTTAGTDICLFIWTNTPWVFDYFLLSCVHMHCAHICLFCEIIMLYPVVGFSWLHLTPALGPPSICFCSSWLWFFYLFCLLCYVFLLFCRILWLRCVRRETVWNHFLIGGCGGQSEWRSKSTLRPNIVRMMRSHTTIIQTRNAWNSCSQPNGSHTILFEPGQHMSGNARIK